MMSPHFFFLSMNCCYIFISLLIKIRVPIIKAAYWSVQMFLCRYTVSTSAAATNTATPTCSKYKKKTNFHFPTWYFNSIIDYLATKTEIVRPCISFNRGRFVPSLTIMISENQSLLVFWCINDVKGIQCKIVYYCIKY